MPIGPVQGGEDDEDDHSGAPTHACHHCTRTFSAAWTEGRSGYTGLLVDLGLSVQESRQAARDGCVFYSHYAESLHQFYEDRALGFPPLVPAEKRIQILIERRTASPAWGPYEPYLMAWSYIDGIGPFTGFGESVCYVVSPEAISGE
jgi:hypothetical protein